MRRLLAMISVAILIALVFVPQHLSARKQEKSSSKYGSAQWAKAVAIPGAEKAGSEACTACHTATAGNFRHSLHSVQGLECEDCHGAGSLHVNGGGDVAKIISFRRRPAEQANAVCLSCHAEHEKVRNWAAGPHQSNGVRCTDCHQTHGRDAKDRSRTRLDFDTTSKGRFGGPENLVPETKVALDPIAKANDACLSCHATQRAQMSMPYHHPLREGKLSCVDCHDPHGGPGGNNLRAASVNQLCLNCHAQYRGPFTYQHPPVNESCLNCHTPHGSPNTNLLTVSEPALCLQCHVAHHNGTGMPLVDRCTNCHGSIHGTDVPSATGGSVFVDKGSAGVHSFPAFTSAAKPAAHSSAALPHAGTIAGLLGTMGMFSHSGSRPTPESAQAGTPESPVADHYSSYTFVPGAYRFVNTTGYAGRVGEYDSLQQSAAGEADFDYVLLPAHLTFGSRANIITGNDYRIVSQLSAGQFLRAGFDIRSFLQQQDNYPFYADVIAPDINSTVATPAGAVFGVKRRMGNAYARAKLPKLPVTLFVNGQWQARVGQTQLAFFDMGGDAECGSCHFASNFQAANYTTRNISGGAEVKLRNLILTWEHAFSSFHDRLQFPTGTYGATLMSLEPVGNVADTPPGTYALDIPSPNQTSADTLRMNWTPLSQLNFNGDVTYTRARNLFTRNPQNLFNADATVNWNPRARLRFTLDYHQQNLLNNFTPFYSLYGNPSLHQNFLGAKIDYGLTEHLDIETRYRRTDVTRSNATLWPQFYSINNTDVLQLVPSSFSNTAGVVLRYHRRTWSTRTGYEWTGTHDPGYLTIPRTNNRMYEDVTLTPFPWLTLTNDTSIVVQNAFPVIQRRNRFYTDTADVTFTLVPNWNLDFGYSYLQNNLATDMTFNNDAGAGYLLSQMLVPYKQLSQNFWVQSAYQLKGRLGFTFRVTRSVAHSQWRPDLNPLDFPGVPTEALDALALGSTTVSQVGVGQLIGEAKVNYLFPHGFDGGLLFYYGSYRDSVNSNLNGILRTYSIYVGRRW